MASDDKVIIGQTHGDDDPEAVLIGYLMAVEALIDGAEAKGAPSVYEFAEGDALTFSY